MRWMISNLPMNGLPASAPASHRAQTGRDASGVRATSLRSPSSEVDVIAGAAAVVASASGASWAGSVAMPRRLSRAGSPPPDEPLLPAKLLELGLDALVPLS